MKFTLYPWQETCLKAWSEHQCRGIINVVTGAGKTVLAVAAIEQLKNISPQPLRVKIVVPTTFLLSQWRDALLQFSDSPAISREEIGYFYGARKDSADREYLIYVINSARYNLARHILNDFESGYSVLLIADECHHYASAENRKIFDFLPFTDHPSGHYYSLGLSATPQTQGYESVLVPALGNEIYRYTFSDAAQNKALTSYALFQIALSFDAREQSLYDTISKQLSGILRRLSKTFPNLRNLRSSQFFITINKLTRSADPVVARLANNAVNLLHARKGLMCNAKARLFCACKLIDLLDPTAKVIIFGERIEQADELYHRLSRRYPNQVGCCHSKMGKQARKNALQRYRNGEIRILVSCRALDEGFDVPAANVGIVLSSAAVERQRIQRLGRILRQYEQKNIACLYYLYLEHSVESPVFFETVPEEALSFHVSYSREDDAFSFPPYEDAALKILSRLQKTCVEQKSLFEVRKCLAMGMLRSDWLLGKVLSPDVWEANIQTAKSTAEKNYWLCMREMGELFLG